MAKKLYTEAKIVQKDGDMIAVASEEVKDRMDEVLSIDGWKLSNFRKEPQLLWVHGRDMAHGMVPLGHARNIGVRLVDGTKKLVFKPVFHKLTELSRTVAELYEKGWMKSFSVGFLPKKTDETGKKYLSQELLEISTVPVPALPSAQVLSATKDLLSKDKMADNLKEYEKVKKAIEKWEKEIMVEEKEPEISTKPYPNEHACRLKDPDQYDTCRRGSRKHNGKTYHIIFCKKEGGKMEEQAYRYPKASWSAAEAKTHCKEHKGTFEAAQEESKDVARTIKLTKDDIAIFKNAISALQDLINLIEPAASGKEAPEASVRKRKVDVKAKAKSAPSRTRQLAQGVQKLSELIILEEKKNE